MRRVRKCLHLVSQWAASSASSRSAAARYRWRCQPAVVAAKHVTAVTSAWFKHAFIYFIFQCVYCDALFNVFFSCALVSVLKKVWSERFI